MMKKISLFLLCIAAVAVVGCKKNSEPGKDALTGLPLAKKVFEQVNGASALDVMRNSSYDSVTVMKGGGAYYTYGSPADTIIVAIVNDTVLYSTVNYRYSGNVISTTCLQYLENNLGSSTTLMGQNLDSVSAMMRSDKPSDFLPITVYHLYSYQAIVDTIKTDPKLVECEMFYESRTEKPNSPVAKYWVEYDGETNTTRLSVGYDHKVD